MKIVDQKNLSVANSTFINNATEQFNELLTTAICIAETSGTDSTEEALLTICKLTMANIALKSEEAVLTHRNKRVEDPIHLDDKDRNATFLDFLCRSAVFAETISDKFSSYTEKTM